jgi:hypothetical protein
MGAAHLSGMDLPVGRHNVLLRIRQDRPDQNDNATQTGASPAGTEYREGSEGQVLLGCSLKPREVKAQDLYLKDRIMIEAVR